METLIGAAGGQASGPDPVLDSDTARFAEDVIDASMAAPVIVDFWAPWCGPCRQLGPAIEKVVRAAKGAVRLVKINVDENQDLAAQLRVQSIPAVFAFFQGQPVDGFAGALPESQIKAFVDRLIAMAGSETGPSPAEQAVEKALEQAEALAAAGDHAAAAGIYEQIVAHVPDDPRGIAGLVRAKLALGEIEEATELLDAVSEELTNAPEIQAARASLELASLGDAAGDIAELSARVEANADDHQARFDLAAALFAAGKAEGAIAALLEIVRRERSWDDDAARKQLVKIFEALGPKDPVMIQGRRRLSSMLFS